MSKSKVLRKKLRNQLLSALEAAGMTGETVNIPNGAYQYLPVLDQNGLPKRSGDKQEFYQIPKTSARNLRKNLINRLLDQGEEAVKAFLGQDLGDMAKAQEIAKAEEAKLAVKIQKAMAPALDVVAPGATKTEDTNMDSLKQILEAPIPTVQPNE